MKQISGGRMRRGQAAVALCVAVAALSLLVSLVALWRSHAAMYDAEQALRAGGATPGLQAALEQVLTATDPGEPTMRVEPTDEPSPRAEPVASEPAEGAALAANGQAILAQGDDAASTAVVAPPAHRWDGPTVPAVPAGTVVPWDEARGHFSRTITVEGKVVETGAGRSGQPVYLNFSRSSRGRMTSTSRCFATALRTRRTAIRGIITRGRRSA
ncbi:MAG: hypothetical protein AAF823_16025 [Planctomycetota bacterium]